MLNPTSDVVKAKILRPRPGPLRPRPWADVKARYDSQILQYHTIALIAG